MGAVLLSRVEMGSMMLEATNPYNGTRPSAKVMSPSVMVTFNRVCELATHESVIKKPSWKKKIWPWQVKKKAVRSKVGSKHHSERGSTMSHLAELRKKNLWKTTENYVFTVLLVIVNYSESRTWDLLQPYCFCGFAVFQNNLQRSCSHMLLRSLETAGERRTLKSWCHFLEIPERPEPSDGFQPSTMSTRNTFLADDFIK